MFSAQPTFGKTCGLSILGIPTCHEGILQAPRRRNTAAKGWGCRAWRSACRGRGKEERHGAFLEAKQSGEITEPSKAQDFFGDFNDFLFISDDSRSVKLAGMFKQHGVMF